MISSTFRLGIIVGPSWMGQQRQSFSRMTIVSFIIMLPCKLKVIHIIYQHVQSDTIIYYYNHMWWYAAYYHIYIYIYIVTFFVTGSSRSVLTPIPCRRMPRRRRWSVAWVCACEQETFRPLSPALIRHECHWSHEHGPIVHLVNYEAFTKKLNRKLNL